MRLIAALLLTLSAPLFAARVPNPDPEADARTARGIADFWKANIDCMNKARDDQRYSVEEARQCADSVANSQNEMGTVRFQMQFTVPSWVPEEIKKNPLFTSNGTVRAFQNMLRLVVSQDEEEKLKDLQQAYHKGEALIGDNRVNVDHRGELAANIAGAYKYGECTAEAEDARKEVLYSRAFESVICKEVGDRPCAATAAHELCHAKYRAQGKIFDGLHVKDNELDAFVCEFKYLEKAYDLHWSGGGDALDETAGAKQYGWMVHNVMHELQSNGRPYSPETREFVIHLTKLVYTKGDEEKLKAEINRLGYQNDPTKVCNPPSQQVASK